MVATQTKEVRLQPDAFSLINRFDEGASRVMKRSIEYARLRGGSIVLPQDAKAAIEELLADVQSMLMQLCGGQLAEIELSDADFDRLSSLPCRVADVVNDADDTL